MPDLVEQMYCAQQIYVPTNLPNILKKYAKAAIRTQPMDLLVWSAAYFQAIVDGIPPPEKLRLEYPPQTSPSGLSPGFLKVLIRQFGKEGKYPKDLIYSRWQGVCLKKEDLDVIMHLGHWKTEVDWRRFIAICAGTLEPCLTRTMILLCDLLTDEPEGGSAMIPFGKFMFLYRYLAEMNCGPVNPFPEPEQLKAEEKPEEKEEIPQQTKIKFKKVDASDDSSIQTWDSVIDKAAEKRSVDSIETLRTSDAQDGLIWDNVDISSEALSDEVSPQPSDEDATSHYGIQVFEKTELEPETQRIKLLNESGVPIKERSETELKKLDEKREQLKKERDDIFLEIVAEGEDMMRDKASIKKERSGELLDESIEEDKAGPQTTLIESLNDLKFMDEMEKVVELPVIMREKIGAEDSEEEVIPPLDRAPLEAILPEDDLAQEDDSPEVSAAESAGDIRDITKVEDQTIGEKLKKVTSLIDVRIDATRLENVQWEKEEEDDEEEEEEQEGGMEIDEFDLPFWAPFKGIGPVIPDDQIEAVADYLKCCADRQNDMVMPRNLRHFLCPPLDVAKLVTEELPLQNGLPAETSSCFELFNTEN